GGDVGVESASIVPFERESDEEALTVGLLPVDLEATLGLVGEEEQIRTVGPVDAHAASARHVAGDRIPGHRLTALRVAHHEAVHALDANALRSAHTVDEPLDERGLGRLLLIEIGKELLEDGEHVDVALPDRRVEML